MNRKIYLKTFIGILLQKICASDLIQSSDVFTDNRNKVDGWIARPMKKWDKYFNNINEFMLWLFSWADSRLSARTYG